MLDVVKPEAPESSAPNPNGSLLARLGGMLPTLLVLALLVGIAVFAVVLLGHRASSLRRRPTVTG